MQKVVRELLIFFGIFAILAFAVHFKAWLDHPIQHIESLPASSMGVWHPVFLSLIAYLIVVIIRGAIYLFKKMFAK